jgi:hypothetical protein
LLEKKAVGGNSVPRQKNEKVGTETGEEMGRSRAKAGLSLIRVKHAEIIAK